MKLRMMRWAEHVARMGQTSNTDTVLAVRTGRKRQLRRASPSGKMKLEGTSRNGSVWIEFEWLRTETELGFP
jgi:hypothetical protein